MNALISFIFPILAKSSGGTPFAFFAAMMVLQFFVVLFIYPETKGISSSSCNANLELFESTYVTQFDQGCPMNYAARAYAYLVIVALLFAGAAHSQPPRPDAAENAKILAYIDGAWTTSPAP